MSLNEWTRALSPESSVDCWLAPTEVDWPLTAWSTAATTEKTMERANTVITIIAATFGFIRLGAILYF